MLLSIKYHVENDVLKPFRILKNEQEPNVEGIDYPILLNTKQIMSIKPINILHNDNIIAGHWVRLSTGKKYKATRIPQELIDLLGSDQDLAPMNINGETTDTHLFQ